MKKGLRHFWRKPGFVTSKYHSSKLTLRFCFCWRRWCWCSRGKRIFCFKSTSNHLSRMEHHKHLISSRELRLIPQRSSTKSPQQTRPRWSTIIKLHISTRIRTRTGWTLTEDKVSKRKHYNFVSWRGNVPGTISGSSVVTLWVVCATYFAAAWERNCFLGTNCKQWKRNMLVWENKHRLFRAFTW